MRRRELAAVQASEDPVDISGLQNIEAGGSRRGLRVPRMRMEHEESALMRY